MLSDNKFELVQLRRSAVRVGETSLSNARLVTTKLFSHVRKQLAGESGARLSRNVVALSVGTLAVLGPLVFLDGKSSGVAPMLPAHTHSAIAVNILDQELSADASKADLAQRVNSARGVQEQAWQIGVLAAIADFSHFQAQVEGSKGRPDNDLIAAYSMLKTDSDRMPESHDIRAARFALSSAAYSDNLNVKTDSGDLISFRNELQLLASWANARVESLSLVLDAAESRNKISNSGEALPLLSAFTEAGAWGYVGSEFLNLSLSQYETTLSKNDLLRDAQRLAISWQAIGGVDRNKSVMSLGSNSEEGRNRLAAMAFEYSQIARVSESLIETVDQILTEGSLPGHLTAAAEMSGADIEVAP